MLEKALPKKVLQAVDRYRATRGIRSRAKALEQMVLEVAPEDRGASIQRLRSELRALIGSGGLEEAEAIAVASREVRAVRDAQAPQLKSGRVPPTSEEIRRRREARRGK